MKYAWIIPLIIVVIVILGKLAAKYLHQQQLSQLKNNFIDIVSHEFKTPLTSIKMLIDTLLEGQYHDQTQLREYLELISKENERLNQLIDKFLIFLQIEQDTLTFKFAPIQPGRIATMAVEAVQKRLQVDGFDLQTEIHPNLPTIIADHNTMVTALVNLLDNACKYSENEKYIQLRVYRQDTGNVCFEVIDKGIGLSQATIKKIFDRFYQVDQNLSRKTDGCGLGLSIVKFIVDAHGGTIAVKSQLGNGSIFTIQLRRDYDPGSTQ